jgi:hypothetical protein
MAQLIRSPRDGLLELRCGQPDEGKTQRGEAAGERLS